MSKVDVKGNPVEERISSILIDDNLSIDRGEQGSITLTFDGGDYEAFFSGSDVENIIQGLKLAQHYGWLSPKVKGL